MASLLFYTTSSDKYEKNILESIKAQLPGEIVELCSTINDLACKLSERNNDKKMAILMPKNEEELIDIFLMQNLFNAVPVMLVLPNGESFVEAMGYRLRPWLTCYRKGGASEIVSKLMNKVKSFATA